MRRTLRPLTESLHRFFAADALNTSHVDHGSDHVTDRDSIRIQQHVSRMTEHNRIR